MKHEERLAWAKNLNSNVWHCYDTRTHITMCCNGTVNSDWTRQGIPPNRIACCCAECLQKLMGGWVDRPDTVLAILKVSPGCHPVVLSTAESLVASYDPHARADYFQIMPKFDQEELHTVVLEMEKDYLAAKRDDEHAADLATINRLKEKWNMR